MDKSAIRPPLKEARAIEGNYKAYAMAIYDRLCCFRMLEWTVDSLPPPWDSTWKGIQGKPTGARALTVVTVWQEIEDKPEWAYMSDPERDEEHPRTLGWSMHPIEQPYTEPEKG